MVPYLFFLTHDGFEGYLLRATNKREKLFLHFKNDDFRNVTRAEAKFQNDDTPENIQFNGITFKKRPPQPIKHEDKRWKHDDDYVIIDIFKNDKNVKELKLSAVNLGNLNKIMDNFDEFLQK